MASSQHSDRKFACRIEIYPVSKVFFLLEMKIHLKEQSAKDQPEIDHFTVVGLVTWPLNGSEAGGDLVFMQTSLLLLCKSSCSYAN